MGEMQQLQYSSNLDIQEDINSSFKHAVLRICYHGKNRNGSLIEKSVIERCMDSIYHCPVVCNYIEEDNEIGGHDVEVRVDDDGSCRLVHVTEPVGVIPGNARTWWEMFTEKDGSEHEYLCSDVLLWKRQRAYKKLVEDGITDQSMEIDIGCGHHDEDGSYVIDNFQFTAFCLLGRDRPCFESASLSVFSLSDFSNQIKEMMKDYSDMNSVNAPENNDGCIYKETTEGGCVLKDEALIDGVIDNGVIEGSEGSVATEPAVEEEVAQADFALESTFRATLVEAVQANTRETDWGHMPIYYFVDYSRDKSEVYYYDTSDDWKLYGAPYTVDGDSVSIDFENKSRKQFDIVDFDEGDSHINVFSAVITEVSEKYAEVSAKMDQYEDRMNEAIKDKDAVIDELNSLREFKDTTIAAKIAEEFEASCSEVFAKFTDMEGVEAFSELVENHDGMSVEEIEEKCYAIRGRYGVQANFSLNKSSAGEPKFIVNRDEEVAGSDEPYGGIFKKYGNK